MRARSLANLMEADSALAGLTAHAGRLLRLQRAYENAVPLALARYGRVANLKLGKVVIHAENGAVAAKIRQLATRLTDVFSQCGVQVSEIQVKVQPDQTRDPNSGHFVGATMDDEAKEGISRLADDLPEDSPLSIALRRLAATARLKR
jgi:hypothetical protein